MLLNVVGPICAEAVKGKGAAGAKNQMKMDVGEQAFNFVRSPLKLVQQTSEG
jgi:hypothetical protein